MSDLMHLGSDIELDENFDISLSNGNIGKVSLGQCVSQDLRKGIYKKVFHFLNNDNVSLSEIKEVIKDYVESEPRVNIDSVEISLRVENEDVFFSVDFIPLGTDAVENIIIGV